MNTIRKELGERVYGSTLIWGGAMLGLIVLLTLECLIQK